MAASSKPRAFRACATFCTSSALSKTAMTVCFTSSPPFDEQRMMRRSLLAESPSLLVGRSPTWTCRLKNRYSSSPTSWLLAKDLGGRCLGRYLAIRRSQIPRCCSIAVKDSIPFARSRKPAPEWQLPTECPLAASDRHRHPTACHSTNSSARNLSDGGIESPSDVAVLRLIARK